MVAENVRPADEGVQCLARASLPDVKDRVNGKNDIIEEVAKLPFLESFRLPPVKDLGFEHAGKKLTRSEVFRRYAYVKKDGKRCGC